MLNLKKIILGLGLLGVASSANAVCSFKYDNDPTSSMTNQTYHLLINKTMNENSFFTFSHPVLGVLSYEVFFDSSCILYCNISTRGGAKPRGFVLPTKDGNTNSFQTPDYIENKPGVCSNITNTSALKTIQTYDDTALKNTDTSLINENNILKAKVQALENKVYSCVQ